MAEKNQIVIIIPTYNELENIDPIVKGIFEFLPHAKIFFVDDNSPDGTANKIQKLQNTNSNILLLKRKAKLGLGSAYLEAFHEVIRKQLGQVIVTMDGDLSHPISALSIMTNLVNDYDLVVGSRYIHGGGIKNWPIQRKLLSYFANFYARTFTRTPIYDMTSGFMSFKIGVLGIIDLDQIHSDGYAFLIELKYLFYHSKARILEYPITFTERRLGESKLSGGVIAEAVWLPIRFFFK